MSKTRLINISATGGGYTDVYATIPCRRVEIVEDDAAAATGLKVKKSDDAFTAVFAVAATKEPIILGNVTANQCNGGPILGFPGQNAPANGWLIGTAYVKGDQITDAGLAWYALAATTGEKPNLFPNKWAQVPGYIPATKLISIESIAGATKVRVTEFE